MDVFLSYLPKYFISTKKNTLYGKNKVLNKVGYIKPGYNLEIKGSYSFEDLTYVRFINSFCLSLCIKALPGLYYVFMQLKINSLVLFGIHR